MKKGRPAVPKITIELRPGDRKVEVVIKGKHFDHPPGQPSDEQALLWEAMLAAMKGIDEWRESSLGTSRQVLLSTTSPTSE